MDSEANNIEQAEAARREKRKQATVSRQIEIDDLRWLMSNKRGRRFVWRLLDQAGVFKLSFNTNAMQMAFNEGGRNYGNRLLAEVTSLCPERYSEMLKESTNESDRPNTN